MSKPTPLSAIRYSTPSSVRSADISICASSHNRVYLTALSMVYQISKEGGVPRRSGQISDLPHDRAARRFLRQSPPHLGDELVHIDLVRGECRSTEMGERQEIVDEFTRGQRRIRNHLEIMA